MNTHRSGFLIDFVYPLVLTCLNGPFGMDLVLQRNSSPRCLTNLNWMAISLTYASGDNERNLRQRNLELAYILDGSRSGRRETLDKISASLP
jgi:hypothetical protein